mgnify:CR=1 FL=1
MTFGEALNSTFRKNYATFSGRASRSEYWCVLLFILLGTFGLTAFTAFLASRLGVEEGDLRALLAAVAILGMTIPVLALIVRRFHDVGLSGWWYGGAVFVAQAPLLLALFEGFEVPNGLAELFRSVAPLLSFAVFVVTLCPSTKGVNGYGENPLGLADISAFE